MATHTPEEKADHDGFNAGYNGASADSNPYQASTDRRFDFWKVGYERALRGKASMAELRAKREAAEARQALFSEKLTELLGGEDERREFEVWLAAFIDARTR